VRVHTTMPHTHILLDWLSGAEPYDARVGPLPVSGRIPGRLVCAVERDSSVVSVRGNDIDRDMFPPGRDYRTPVQ